jgi:hypothetical protein
VLGSPLGDADLTAAGSTRDRLGRTAVLVLYLAVLFGSPFFHHDFACHQRTPGHCQACRANPPAPRAAESVAVAAMPLDDVGSIDSASNGSTPRHVPIFFPGRSPPA